MPSWPEVDRRPAHPIALRAILRAFHSVLFLFHFRQTFCRLLVRLELRRGIHACF